MSPVLDVMRGLRQYLLKLWIEDLGSAQETLLYSLPDFG
jgi:hypothetical protein